MSRFIRILSVLMVAVAPLAWSAPDVAGGLPHETLRNQYNEGNFEEVVRLIKEFQAANKTYSRHDSLTIAKHLSVVYTANPATRELGQKYMHDLLKMMPSAELVDMYVSDEIYRIFDRVRKEFQVRNDASENAASESPQALSAAEGNPSPAPQAKKAGGSGKKNSSAKYYWLAGSAALVTVGVTAYMLSTEEPPEDKTYVVPQ